MNCGAKVTKNLVNWTPLHECCGVSSQDDATSMQIAEALIKRKRSAIDEVDAYKNTALRLAVEKGLLQTAKFLLSAGT